MNLILITTAALAMAVLVGIAARNLIRRRKPSTRALVTQLFLAVVNAACWVLIGLGDWLHVVNAAIGLAIAGLVAATLRERRRTEALRRRNDRRDAMRGRSHLN